MKQKRKIFGHSTHDAFKQGAYFEEFVFACLHDEGVVVDTLELFKNVKKSSFDGFVKYGIPNVTNNNTFIEIKYTNSRYLIDSYLKTIPPIDRNKSLVIICLIDEHIDIEGYSNIHVLGVEYVQQLIFKHPRYWWIFIASSSDDNRLSYDESNKVIKVTNPPLAARAFGKEMTLCEDSPQELNSISEADFKRRLKLRNNPAIIVGNGASIHFGSDLWSDLGQMLFDYLSPQYVNHLDLVKKAIGDSIYSSTSMSRFTIDPKKYKEGLYFSLYRKYEKRMHIDKSLIRSVVKVKQKNLSMPLLTYNYDNFLEMDFFDYTKNIIKSVTSCAKDKVTSEPKIRHLHGILPYNQKSRITKVVLTQEDYFKAYKGNSWIVRVQKETLQNYTCLYVGSSMSDLYQMSIIDDVNKRYYSHEKSFTWKCFALLCLKGMDSKDMVAVFNYFLSKGIYIIFTDDYESLPDKLLELFV